MCPYFLEMANNYFLFKEKSQGELAARAFRP